MSSLKMLDLFNKNKPPGRTFAELSKAVRIKSSFCSAVIAAAGDSQRCRGEDKLLYKINGKPVVAHTIEAFQNCTPVREIIVVVKAEQLEMMSGMCSEYGFDKVSKVIAGGDTRTESVINGVFAVSRKAGLVAIHDGARPCVSAALIEKTLQKAAKYHAAAPAVPVISTVKRIDSEAQGDYGPVISGTVDRSRLYEIQTPQIFNTDIIKAGLTKAVKKSLKLTDDCMAAEMLGVPVHVVEGERRNIKITEPDDLRIAEMLLAVESVKWKVES